MDPVGTGGAGPFAYTFKIFSSSHLYVYVGGVLKTINTHYTVSGVGAPTGGNVTFTAGNEPVNGVAILIVRVVPLTQLSDYVNHAAFDAEVLEMDLDKTIMMAQQFNETLNRIAKVGVTSLLTNVTVQEGAGKFLRWNNAGTAIEAENVVPIGQDLSAYALLAGRAGGQTLIGGTAITDILKLQGTSGNGTLTSPAIQFLVGNTGGTVALTVLNNGKIGIGPAGITPASPFVINVNTAALPAEPVAGQTILHLGNADGVPSRFLVDSFGNRPEASLRRCNGTLASPTQLVANDGIGNFGGFGYYQGGTSGYTTASRVSIAFWASESWTDIAQGTYLTFHTTNNGATALTERMRIDNGGNVGIGMTPTYKLDITGNIRCSTGFGCNGTTPQTAYASGGALNAYGAGVAGLNTAGNMSDLHALVVAMRAALVANGIMS